MLFPEQNLSTRLTVGSYKIENISDHIDHTHFHSEGISAQKWAAMGVLSGVSLVCGLLPFWTFSKYNTSRGQLRQMFIMFLSNVSGGILLSTLFLHILPELRHKASHLSSSSHEEEHQIFRDLPELFTLLGFCLIFFLEVAATALLPSSHTHHHHHHHHSQYDQQPEYDPEEGPSCEKNRLGSDETLEHSDSPLKFEDHSDIQKRNDNNKSVWKVIVSLIALSFHAIMEGVAVGLQGESQLWMTFAAIASHKFLISFCVGVELVRAKASLGTTLTSLLSFALVSPVGILLGSSAISIVETNLLVLAEGIACGTLLYVVFFDILLSSSSASMDNNHHHHSGSSRSSPSLRYLYEFIPFTGVTAGIVISTYLMTISGGHSHDEMNLHHH